MKLKVLACALAALSAAAGVPAFGADAFPTATNALPPLTNAIAAGKFVDSAEITEMLRQADAYANGEGVKKDPKKAFKLHKKAAEMGSARAMCLLGLDYADGAGTKKDGGEALRWLRLSADKGWPSAQFDLGLFYTLGNAPGKTASDGLLWYRKAAEQGLPDAEWALGTGYLDGTGAPKDIPEGVRWIRRAADKGFAPAQRSLGICYTKGTGVPKDMVQAYKWLNLAAAKDDLNSDDIRVNLSNAERFMTPEQISEAQQLAREFKPKRIPLPGEPLPPETVDLPSTNAPSAHTNSTALITTNPPAAAPPPVAPVVAAATSAPPAAATAHAVTTKFGFVNIKCDDPSSEVYVNSAFVGNAPAKVKLTTGPHIIEVKSSGFKDYKKQISVGDGAELSLNVVLEKE
jgi:TPR repeat protein